MVVAPSSASPKAENTGERLVASNLFNSRTEGMKYFIVPKYRNPNGKTTARNQGVAKATVAMVAEQEVATESHIAKVTGSSSSMVYKSFEKRLTESA